VTSDSEPFPGQELTPELLAVVDREERFAPGLNGSPDVRLLVYRPKRARTGPPLVVDMHGGGFALRADNFPAGPARLAGLGATVVSVDYRPSTEAPFPGGVEDCYAALCWATEVLDIDRERVAVTGVSAGGALAAALTLMARDWSGPAIAFQALVIPVIDDRCETPSIRQYSEGPLFGGRLAKEMWVRYLGAEADRTITSPYAAPGRADDLHGLPPALIQVNGLDPLRDEGIQYALRLMAADVPVELYCAPNQHHGLSKDPRTAAIATQLNVDAMRAALRMDKPERSDGDSVVQTL
jgi:acetyl esterase